MGTIAGTRTTAGWRRIGLELRRGVALAAIGLLVLTGCADPDGGTAEAPAKPTAPSTTSAPTPARPAPKVGSCHDLGFAEATQAVADPVSVRCRRPHTSVTFEVERLDLIVDGHLVAIDSDTVSRQLDDRCQRGLRRWVGGDSDALRLSRLRSVWFRPSVTQSDRGASWYRCDLVAVARDEQLAGLEGTMRGVLDDPDALDTWGICGTSSPTRKNFRKVICSRPHRWRAVSIVDLPERTRYLGKRAAARADRACQDAATARVNESLRYEWAFQWPTREEWSDGQRYGWCWLPA